jgi:hypothetical protein
VSILGIVFKNIRYGQILKTSLYNSFIGGVLWMIYVGATTPEWDDKPLYWIATFGIFFGIVLLISLPVCFVLEYKKTKTLLLNFRHRQSLFLRRI